MSGDRDARLDAELADTFPASDPPSLTAPTVALGPVPATDRHEEDDVAADVVFLYRVVPVACASDAFEPQQEYSADRWTSAGTPVLYASMTPAGALLEKLAHLADSDDNDVVMAVGSMPADALATGFGAPAGWDALPYRGEVQRLGDQWLARHEHLGTRVPSAPVKREYNVLLDAGHPDLARMVLIETIPISIDPRLRGVRRG